MKKLSLIAFLFASSLCAQVQLGRNVQIGAGASSGTVTQVNTDGTSGISGGPITTTGTVACTQGSASQFGCVKADGSTITASGGVLTAVGSGSGVQYDASNTRYVFTGTSFYADDTHVLGPTLTVTGGTCNATTCVITNSGTNGFSAGDWVWVIGMTGWPGAPGIYGTGSFNNTPYSDIVQVISTGLSPTQFEFLSPITATITGGSAYPANKFIPQQFSTLPFASGHGSIIGVFGADHNCFDVDTNYTAMFHSISPVITGLPGYLIVNGCGNDIVSRLDSAATVEARLQSIWSKAHTDGWVVVQGTMIISSPGALVNGSLAWTTKQVNDWIVGQGQSYSTTTPYCTTDCGKNWDRAVDFYSVMSNLDAPAMFASNGGVGPGGAAAAANLLNESLVNKASSFKTQMAYSYFGFYSNVFPFNSGPGFIFSPPSVDDVFVVTTGDQNTVAFTVGTHAGRVGIQAADIIDNGLSPSTSPICPHGTNGKFTTTGCLGGGTTTNPLTMNNSGSGAASGTTFDGSAAKTISYNTIGAAPLASPTFTGVPAAPTAAPGTNTTQLASTAFVQAAVTGGGSISGQTAGYAIEAATATTATGPFPMDDSITTAATVTVHKALAVNDGSGVGGGVNGTEGTAPTGAATVDKLYADATSHRWKMNPNNAGAFFLSGTAAARTAGNCVSWAANGIDLVDAGGACGISGGGVTSFTGDGTLLSNSGSTGAVSATLANAAAHKFFGNNTGGSAAPGYQTIGTQDASPAEYIAGGGTGNAQTATLSPAATSLATGLRVEWTPTAANTTAATLAVNGLTAKSITKCGTTALAANDLTTTAVAIAVYDGTQFQLINPQAAACGAAATGAWTNGTAVVTPTGCAVSSGACVVSGTTTSVLTFASIPAHNRMQLVLRGQSSSALAGAKLTLNGDTGTNYVQMGSLQASTTNPVSNTVASFTGCNINMDGNIVTQGIYDLAFYADTNFPKSIHATAMAIDSISSLTNNDDQSIACAWNNTAAVTSLTFTLSTGHFIAGTKLMILFQD